MATDVLDLPAFPIWFTMLFPNSWMFLILTQLIIASIVLYAGLRFIDYDNPPAVWKKSFFWITLYGFGSYIIIGVLFLALHFVNPDTAIGTWIIEHIVTPLDTNPFSDFFSILYVSFCLLITDFIAYKGYVKFALKKAPLELEQKKKIALCLIIFSGPYISLFPSIYLV